MQKSDTLEGALEMATFYDAMLQVEISQHIKANNIGLSASNALISALDKRNRALHTIKRLLG